MRATIYIYIYKKKLRANPFFKTAAPSGLERKRGGKRKQLENQRVLALERKSPRWEAMSTGQKAMKVHKAAKTLPLAMAMRMADPNGLLGRKAKGKQAKADRYIHISWCIIHIYILYITNSIM